LNYKTDAFGEIVDKYKFEAGCITEHVSGDVLAPGVVPPKMGSSVFAENS
jgi:hypothetical protein